MKINLKQIYTKRKLFNIQLIDFKDALIDEYSKIFTDSQLKLVIKTYKLMADRMCDKYKLTMDDHLLITEVLKSLTPQIPLIVRKNVELFEIAHNIKTIWFEGDSAKNQRGQNFKLSLLDLDRK